MKFVYSDGGRHNYFNADNVRDCVVRAICNATDIDYIDVYNDIDNLEKTIKLKKRETRGSARNGVRPAVYKEYIEKKLKWTWHPTMTIGSGCHVHLNEKELPLGILIVRCAKHLTCVIDRVLYDTWDCSRKNEFYGNADTQTCVYGYWTSPSNIYLKKEF